MVGHVCNKCWRLRPCTEAGHEPKPFATAKRSSNLYDTTRWKQERKIHLKGEPNCRICSAKATSVDHIIPPRGDEVKFWQRSNWQSVCWPCHLSKTGRETRQREKVRS